LELVFVLFIEGWRTSHEICHFLRRSIDFYWLLLLLFLVVVWYLYR
jgi:hypothetical protein